MAELSKEEIKALARILFAVDQRLAKKERERQESQTEERPQ
jgi:hypothetical protein